MTILSNRSDSAHARQDDLSLFQLPFIKTESEMQQLLLREIRGILLRSYPK
jgi:hypothetical protein